MMGFGGIIIILLNIFIIVWDLSHSGWYLNYLANSAISAGLPGWFGKAVGYIGPFVVGGLFMIIDLLEKEKRYHP